MDPVPWSGSAHAQPRCSLPPACSIMTPTALDLALGACEASAIDWPWSGSRTCWTRFAHEPDPMFGFGFVFLAGPNLNWGPGSTPWVNLNLRSEPEPRGSMPNRRYLPTHQSMDDNLPPTAPQTPSNLHCNTNDATLDDRAPCPY